MKQTIVCDAGTASSDGHTLTFLANSGQRMTNGYTVDLQSLQAPVDGGLLKPVAELADSDKLTLPLLLDHMPSITAQAGIIEKLWITDEGLMARARLSGNGLGEDVRQLASEGMLTNSFSITIDFADEPDENGVIRNAELVEISVVYRGADSKAVFRSLNNREGKTMELKNNLTKDEAQALIDELTDAIHDLTEKTDEDMTPEEPAQSNEAENSKEGEPTVSNGRTNIIINSAGPARQSLAKTSDPLDEWLKSEDATKAYEQALWKADNQGVNGFKAAWREELARHAYSDNSSIDEASVTKLVPTSVITEIEDALNKASDLWPLYRKLDVDSFTVGAQLAGLTDDTRAHIFDKFFQGDTSPVQAVINLLGGEAGYGANLCIGKAIQILQLQHLAVLRCQALQTKVQQFIALLRYQIRLQITAIKHLIHILQRQFPFMPAQICDSLIVGDSVEPGANTPFIRETPTVRDQVGKGILHHVLRCRRRSCYGVCIAHQRICVCTDQPFQFIGICGWVAAVATFTETSHLYHLFTL